MEKQKVGRVEHYYGSIGVAVVKLSAPLRTGDKIAVENARGQQLLEQAVESMQIEHEHVQQAKAGDSVGLKVSAKVHDGNVVYRI